MAHRKDSWSQMFEVLKMVHIYLHYCHIQNIYHQHRLTNAMASL